ncbi:MAG: hypothetical protein GX594_01320 [Pirellulaceae bacterium]|nr:hypothetical protein [Pirellulaceae bacterium]
METSALRKAAVVLMSLPKDRADDLLGRISPDEAAAVSREMARLGELNPEEQAAAFDEFLTAAERAKPPLPTEQHPFDFLRDVKPKILAEVLVGEQPQTIALVVSCLPLKQGAETLDALPPDCQTSVARRLAALERPDREILEEVAHALRNRLAGGNPRRCGGGVGFVVKILNAMQPAGERRLLAELAQLDPGLHRQIRLAMFGPDVADAEVTDGINMVEAVDAA